MPQMPKSKMAASARFGVDCCKIGAQGLYRRSELRFIMRGMLSFYIAFEEKIV